MLEINLYLLTNYLANFTLYIDYLMDTQFTTVRAMKDKHGQVGGGGAYQTFHLPWKCGLMYQHIYKA